MNKKIINLYEHFKNTPKKLKVVCDWDEVIQACEPYSSWLALKEKLIEGTVPADFSNYFNYFWDDGLLFKLEYSPYSFRLDYKKEDKLWILEKQQQIKNSPNFYQEAPFLTIAEDLLKLIKEDKIESLMFLSAYDKRKFSDKDEDGDEIGDKRKYEIFEQTFDKLDNMHSRIGNDGREMIRIATREKGKTIVNMVLLGFDSETQGQNKVDWIKKNASDFDIVIDDNPNICKEVNSIFAKMCHSCYSQIKDKKEFSITCFHPRDEIKVFAPYYPSVKNQHHEEVLLVKNEVSDLKKEDFG